MKVATAVFFHDCTYIYIYASQNTPFNPQLGEFHGEVTGHSPAGVCVMHCDRKTWTPWRYGRRFEATKFQQWCFFSLGMMGVTKGGFFRDFFLKNDLSNALACVPVVFFQSNVIKSKLTPRMNNQIQGTE